MSVRNALLGLLAQRPRHGYELHAAFEAVVGGEEIWDVKPAQVYTTLIRLEESGLVQHEGLEAGGGPDKRVYALTPAGHAELTTWLLTGQPSGHERDEFFIKLMLSVATGAASPQQVVQAQRARLFQELHATTTRRRHVDPQTALAQLLLLDKTIMHLEADLRWLDIVESRLEEVRRQPLPEPEVKPRGRPKKHQE